MSLQQAEKDLGGTEDNEDDADGEGDRGMDSFWNDDNGSFIVANSTLFPDYAQMSFEDSYNKK